MQDEQLRSRLPFGCGCALVFPTAFIGTVMIVDHPGPPGRFGGLEYPGWWGLCAAVSLLSAAFLRRFKDRRGNRPLQLFSAMGVPLAFALLLIADLNPDTPGRIKLTVEYSLQALGMPVVGLLILFVSWVGWSSCQGGYRRPKGP